MLVTGVFRNINRAPASKYKKVRFLNSQAALEEAIGKTKRKYVKQSFTSELLPWYGSNLNNLFAGTIDKKVFEYPRILFSQDIDAVFNHSRAVENFFNHNQDSKLTNDILQQLKELELFGLSLPQKFGGAGYNETETKYLLECTGCNPTIARFLGYKEDFGCRIINSYGTEEQKRKYLPNLAEGKLFMTLAYLENGPLIDLSKMEGYVISDLDNNRFILNAEKKWVHYADNADLFLVMVKSANILKEKCETQTKFNMFIIENNSPGVIVHKLKSHQAEKANLYEVSFKNVCVPFTNLLGGPETDGFVILKYGLSHSNLTDATLCLSLMKHILYNAINFVEEKNLKDIKVRGHLYIRENIATLISYIYALESVIYLLTGILDMYEKPDLFNDAIMAKVLAVDFVRMAIQMYTEIIGHESFKKSGVIEEAFEALQYHSVFDENIEYFKLMAAADGLISAAPKLSKNIKILRNPYESPYTALKLQATKNLKSKKLKSQMNFKIELHSSLSRSADIVEENLVTLLIVLENLFLEKGNLAIYCEHSIAGLAEIASYIFAGIACLSRASSSICYDLHDFKNEFLIAQAFTKMIDMKIQKLCEEEFQCSELLEYYRIIGKNSFNFKEYPVDHPLSRAF